MIDYFSSWDQKLLHCGKQYMISLIYLSFKRCPQIKLELIDEQENSLLIAFIW